MTVTLTRGKVTLHYVREPLAIETIDLDRIVAELEDGTADSTPLRWVAQHPLTAYDRLIVASERDTGRCIGFVGVQDGATERDETFFHIRAFYVAERARGRGLMRRMLATLMLRAIGNEEVPDALVVRTSRAPMFYAMHALAKQLPGITFYPSTPGQPTQLRAADLARRVARRVGYGLRFCTATGAFRGGLFSYGLTPETAPVERLAGLLGAEYGAPDEVLALLDLRGVTEEALTEANRAIYRRS